MWVRLTPDPYFVVLTVTVTCRLASAQLVHRRINQASTQSARKCGGGGMVRLFWVLWREKQVFFYGFLTKTKNMSSVLHLSSLFCTNEYFFFKQSHKAEINEATVGLSRMCLQNVCTKLPKCPDERSRWSGSRATLLLPYCSPSSASCRYLKIPKNAEQVLKRKVTCLGSCALSHGIGVLIAVDSYDVGSIAALTSSVATAQLGHRSINQALA